MNGEIEDKPQPLIEHLIELRTRLIWSLAAFFVAFLVCFFLPSSCSTCSSFPTNGLWLGWP